MKNKVKYLLIPVISAMLLLAFFSAREWGLNRSLELMELQLQEKLGLEIAPCEVQWTSANNVYFDTLYFRSESGNNYLRFTGLELSVSPLSLANGKIELSSLTWAEAEGKYEIEESGKPAGDKQAEELSLRDRFDHLIALVNQFPKSFDLGPTQFSIVQATNNFAVSFQRMNLYSQDQNNLELNLLDLHVCHPSLALDTLLFSNINFQFQLSSNNENITLGEQSILHVGQLELKPIFEYSNEMGRLKLGLNMPIQAIQSIISATPQAFLPRLEGMIVKGDFDWEGQISLDLDSIHSLRIESNSNLYEAEIEQYGFADLSLLQGEFTHLPFGSAHAFSMSKDNPNYVCYDQVPDLLKDIILLAEDARYFEHRGFDRRIIRHAMIDNFKSRKWKRGGSTISMQLIKNTLLSPEKTISRKAEEAILVWLMEEMKLLSKERILECYFNLIEWGPEVYGISQAANFYFSKSVQELSLSEMVFIAIIIPNPKLYFTYFDHQGMLTPFAKNIFAGIAIQLFDQDKISEAQLDELLDPVVHLNMSESGMNDLFAAQEFLEF